MLFMVFVLEKIFAIIIKNFLNKKKTFRCFCRIYLLYMYYV